MAIVSIITDGVQAGRARTHLFLVLLLTFPSSFVDAQSDIGPSGCVVGRVTQEGTPLASTNIIVIGTRIGALTGEDGSFQLDQVPVGQRAIQFQAIGCDKALLTVEVRAGMTDTVAVDLRCPLRRCFHQEHFTADCFRANDEERRRVGTRCKVHKSVVLLSDTVRIHYGLQIAVRPEVAKLQSESFPNARNDWDAGCDIERWAFTNVAYCSACRKAHERWLGQGGR